jgi:hypothetical protein
MATWQFGGFAPDFNGPDFSPLSILQTDTGSKNVGALFTLDFGTKSYTSVGAAPVGVSFAGATGIYSWAGAVTPGSYSMITRCSGSDSPPSYTDYSWTLTVNTVVSGNKPLFTGPIDDQVTLVDTTINTGAFFTGATSYAIAPALSTGMSLNTGNGVITVTVLTSGNGYFGPYIITATNAVGTTDSNSFSITVAVVTAPADYSDTSLQALLDPLDNNTGIRIIRRSDVQTTVNYYVVPVQNNRGRAQWVEVLATDDVNARYTKIITATGIASQPTWPLS